MEGGPEGRGGKGRGPARVEGGKRKMKGGWPGAGVGGFQNGGG